MTPKQSPDPIQRTSQIDWRRIGITTLFLLITLIFVFLSSQWALFFIDRSQIAGGIFSRSLADYSPGVSVALAPLDRDRIITEIISDELSLTARNVAPLAGSIVVALLPRTTLQQSPVASSPTPVPATVVVVAPASPTPIPVIPPTVAATSTPTGVPVTPSPPPTLAPTISPTSTPAPPTPTSTSVTLPTSTPTTVVPVTSTPTSTSSPTRSAPTSTATSVPSTPTFTPSPSPTTTSGPVNQPPETTDDDVQLDEDAILVINVLDNDTDPDGLLDPTSLWIVSPPLHGTATVVTGTIVYSPDPNYSGNDTFTYQICDLAGACSTGTVMVTVLPVNDAPVAVDDNITTNEDTSVNILVLANDSDVESDPLSISAVGAPASGTAIRVGGFITYTPNPNFFGQDSFTYVVSDGLLTDTGTVSVTVLPVNDAPVAVDDFASTAEDSPEDIPVRLNDFDVDGDTLTVIVVGQPLNGTTTTNGISVRYTPFANYNGTDMFTYTISDGQASDSATVTVNVISINDRPTARNDVYNTTVNSPLNVGPPGVLTNDSDPEGTALTASLVSGPTNGVLLLNSNGSFSYTPNLGFIGVDIFTYEASDGTAFSVPATVTVNVTN